MASNEPKILSTGVRDERSTDSVFDFLYYDAPRIASFLSQFDKSGHLTEIVQGERAQRSKQSSSKAETSGGVPTVITAGGSHTRDTGAEYERDSQRVYDPAWANALAFLDYLDERSLINREIAKASIGQFVLSSGSLAISDLQLVEKMWRLPSIQKTMEAGIPQPKNHAERKRLEADINSPQHTFKMFLDLITVLPHTIQANISGQADVWCSLSQLAMAMNPADIILKHGTGIPGDWHILGILDALPEGSAPPPPVINFLDPIEMAMKMMRLIAPVARTFLGRPPKSYGMTPLLIFRQISV